MLKRLAIIIALHSPAALAVGEIDYWNMTHIDYELDYEISFRNCMFRRLGELASTEDDRLISCQYYARTMGEPQMTTTGTVYSKQAMEDFIQKYEKLVVRIRKVPLPSDNVPPIADRFDLDKYLNYIKQRMK